MFHGKNSSKKLQKTRPIKSAAYQEPVPPDTALSGGGAAGAGIVMLRPPASSGSVAAT
jgi:hypothetical protein